ncbi:major facilitator superfamily transporter permease [Lactobacillus selangorensis]|uniref:Major facilitator superfamily transporter permease n=1 Tax=Lactobacillus selangorensis TaxID=81857 RepID=A0A0R2FWS0_9LACO|nr:MFS transporter [Lactobacillus selangorensis]KRN28781.1 major facilitator superfamily transporter permease [Lactobacillus selangorensis]KRN32809.1 major facilitator superfamily transporter permease [Lactobacillus selangorensis]
MSPKKQTEAETPRFKIALLSISILLMMAPVVSSTVPAMSKTFAHQSASAVEALVTIPNLGLIFGIFIGSVLAVRWGAKKTILLGLAGAFLFGVFPAISSNYTLILGSRFLLGLSLGLYNSLAISLIPDFYSGDELSTMMGYQSAVQSLGNSIFSFVVGYLLLFSWHAAYWIYAIALPVFVLFNAVIPNVKPQQTQTTANKQTAKVKQRINGKVLIISILTFFVFSFFMVITVKLAGLLTTEKIGTASEAAAILGGYTLLSMFVGFAYGWIHKLMGRTVLPIGLGIMALGFFIITLMHSLIGVTIAVLVIGVGYSIANPYIFTVINLVAPTGSKNLASSVMLVFLNIGAFIGPIWVDWVAKLVGNTSVITDMLISAAGLVILAVLTGIHQLLHRPQQTA